MTYQRDTDIAIGVINDRLAKLEDISADIQEIREWVQTMKRLQEYAETMGNFLSRWAVIFGKITAGCAIGWASVKYGISGLWDIIRGVK